MYSENRKLTLIFSLCFNISIYNLELHKYANYGTVGYALEILSNKNICS